MVKVAKEVFRSGFNPTLAYILSDEINYLFLKESIFNRRIEKILSIIPSIISSRMSLEIYKKYKREESISFDARVIIISKEKIIEYLIWRQMEAWRNHINAYALHALLRNGLEPSQAAKKLYKMKAEKLHDLVLEKLKINLAKTPSWQRRGIIVKWKLKVKKGRNPITGEEVQVTRRVLDEDWNPPLFTTDEGREYIKNIIWNIEKELRKRYMS